MPSPSPLSSSYSLRDLEYLTSIPERTIRSYISIGLLPPPIGRGRAVVYTAEHLLRLQFMQRVREAVQPFEIPLDSLRAVMSRLSPEQIERVARGEEPVQAVSVFEALSPDAGLAARSTIHAAKESSIPRTWSTLPRAANQELDPERSHGPVETETWTTVQITPDLRLSMRGPAAPTTPVLLHLAERLRTLLPPESPS